MQNTQMCKMCKFAQFGKIDENGQNAKKHHLGGSKIDIFRRAKVSISDAAARGNPAELCIV